MIYRDFQDKKLSLLGFGTMRLPLIDGVIDQYIGTVKIRHSIYVEPTKKYADLIVNGGKNHVALGIVASKIAEKIDDKKLAYR